ncbi:ATP-dependent DNA helicase RecQ [Candidatus Pacearchaeota archaeon]|nr:ATP-dependent DNA helicase RecQ [Candidatus Pacearchaeota archaeon]
MLFTEEEAKQTLKKVFGYDEFRPGQLEAIMDLSACRDVAVIMPTSAGKSIIYQIPAICAEGTALVVSPLISLMKDQVDTLISKRVKAAFLNSTLKATEQRSVLERFRNDKLKILYVTPERFRSSVFKTTLIEANISIFAIDESHSISSWGHDFRPDYRRLGDIKDILNVPTIGLTATATVKVQNDIIDQLHMKNVAKHIYGFDRPNLEYDIQYFNGDFEKEAAVKRHIMQMVKDGSDPAIFYCGTRKQTDRMLQIARSLRGMKIPRIGNYHGGMKNDDRENMQNEFLNSDTPWIAATNAFGMGINKADVRNVIHVGVPGSVEAWYQEVGRAGRDGKPAKCTLFYCQRDLGLQWFFIEMANPPKEVFQHVWEMLWTYGDGVVKLTQKKFYENFKSLYGGAWGEGCVSTALRVMKKSGAIDPNSKRGQMVLPDYPNKKSIESYVDFTKLAEKEKMDRDRFKQMLNFLEDHIPIRERVLQYFGEKVK